MRTSIYAAINAELTAIHAYVPLLVGDENIARNDPPPRMIAFPSDDSFDGRIMPGANPRQVGSVFEGSTLVIHGQTIEHVTGMRDQFFIALHKACKKSTPGKVQAADFRISSGKWKRAQFHASKGWEFTLQFAVLQPITDRKWADVAPPEAPIASTYTGPGALTYPLAPTDGRRIVADVGVRDNPPADDNPTVIIPEE